MKKGKIIFNIYEDILYQIGMMTYEELNNNFCSINEHLGDIYFLKDIRNMEQCKKNIKAYHQEKHFQKVKRKGVK